MIFIFANYKVDLKRTLSAIEKLDWLLISKFISFKIIWKFPFKKVVGPQLGGPKFYKKSKNVTITVRSTKVAIRIYLLLLNFNAQ